MVKGIRSHSKRKLTERKKLLERYKLGLWMRNCCRLRRKMSMLLLSSHTKDFLWTKHSSTSRINSLHHDRLLWTSKLFRAHSLLFSFISHNSKKIENSLADTIILRIPKMFFAFSFFFRVKFNKILLNCTWNPMQNNSSSWMLNEKCKLFHLDFKTRKNTPDNISTFVKRSFANIKIQHKPTNLSHHKPFKACSLTLEFSELSFKGKTYSSSLAVVVTTFSYFSSLIDSLCIFPLFLDFNLSCFYCY